jgi:hypothetical protein
VTKGADRRNLFLVEVQRVSLVAIERFSRAILLAMDVYRILRRMRAKSDSRDRSSSGVVRSIASDDAAESGPAVSRLRPAFDWGGRATAFAASAAPS